MLTACVTDRAGRARNASAIFSFSRSSPLSMCWRPARWRPGSAASTRPIAGRITWSASSLRSAQHLVASAFCSGGEAAAAVARPGAVGLGLGRWPRSFWVPLFVVFPGCPQLRDCLGPCVAGRLLIGGLGSLLVAGVLRDLPFSQAGCLRGVYRPLLGGRRPCVAFRRLGVVVAVNGHCSPPGLRAAPGTDRDCRSRPSSLATDAVLVRFSNRTAANDHAGNQPFPRAARTRHPS